MVRTWLGHGRSQALNPQPPSPPGPILPPLAASTPTPPPVPPPLSLTPARYSKRSLVAQCATLVAVGRRRPGSRLPPISYDWRLPVLPPGPCGPKSGFNCLPRSKSECGQNIYDSNLLLATVRPSRFLPPDIHTQAGPDKYPCKSDPVASALPQGDAP